ATVPEATIGAIDALSDNLFTLITGGYDAKVNYKNLASKILKSKIRILILFEPTGKKILNQIKKKKRKINLKIFFPKNIQEAVKLAFSLTPKKKSCLFSPASPSFGLFRNYKERGNLFKKFVKKYGKN
ncbi:MAG: UDP-N-acetylmuramoyl-L-alanine--D-glutamate ligase, partial [Minisyncoccales bacterium]